MRRTIHIETVLLHVFGDADYRQPRYLPEILTQFKSFSDRVTIRPIPPRGGLVDDYNRKPTILIVISKEAAAYKRRLNDSEIIRAHSNYLCGELLRRVGHVFNNNVRIVRGRRVRIVLGGSAG